MVVFLLQVTGVFLYIYHFLSENKMSTKLFTEYSFTLPKTLTYACFVYFVLRDEFATTFFT